MEAKERGEKLERLGLGRFDAENVQERETLVGIPPPRQAHPMTARRKPERKHRLEAPHLSHTAGETYLNRRSIHAEGFDPDRRRRRLVEVAAHGGDAPCRGPQEEMTLRLRAVVDHGLHSPFVGEFEDAAGGFGRGEGPSAKWDPRAP